MKRRLSLRTLLVLLFVGVTIPVLIVVEFLVYRLQQSYLLNDAERRLVGVVRSGVAQHAGEDSLTVLALSLGEPMRVMGADLFIQDADGKPVPPALGTGPWLSADAQATVREERRSRLEVIEREGAPRLVYLSAIVDPEGEVLGSVEASLSLATAEAELEALRRWLLLIVAVAIGLSVLIAVPLSATVTRPLDGMLAAVERVQQGHLDTRAPVPQISELGQLAVAYNTMLDRVEADLEAQAQQAETMRRFAADASHELRSPLTVFRNGVDLLERADRQGSPEQAAGILVMLRQEVDTMTRLVEALLLLARLEQPEAAVESQLHPEEILPYPLLEEVYERSLLLADGQEVELIWPDTETPAIRADRALVREALNNVVENAIAYTPAGKRVTLRVVDRDGFCDFIVEDQGVGIPQDQLPRIFERFYRGDTARNRRRGTGLGLAIVAAIVRAHDGRIDVQSQPGKGTVFRLSFRQAPPRSQ